MECKRIFYISNFLISKLKCSDLDFEYPDDADQAQGFADLLTELRSAFNALQAKKKDSTCYLVTAAVAAGPENYSKYKVSQMDAALDYWNLMASFFCYLYFLH